MNVTIVAFFKFEYSTALLLPVLRAQYREINGLGAEWLEGTLRL